MKAAAAGRRTPQLVEGRGDLPRGDASHSEELARGRHRLVMLQLFSVATWLAFGVKNAFARHPITAIINTFAAGAVLLLYVLTRRAARRIDGLTHATAAVSSVALVAGATITGQSRSLAIWFLVAAPWFVAHQLGRRGIVLWSAIAAALIGLVHASERFVRLTPEFVPHDLEMLIGRLGLLAVLVGFATLGARDGERHVAEIGRRASELSLVTGRLHAALASLPVAICASDTSGVLVLVNDATRALLGRGQLREGAPLESLEHMVASLCKRPEEQRAWYESARERRAPASTTIELVDGTVLECEYVPVVTDGQWMGDLYAHRDVTERRVVARMKTEFISTVSHELRTPLAASDGALRLMLGGAAGELTTPLRELLQIAAGNVERLTSLIENLLDAQKLHSGGETPKTSPVPIDAMVAHALGVERKYAAAAGVTLRERLASDGAEVRCERQRIEQVLSILLGNAIKFSARGSVVAVETSLRGDRVRVEVRDRAGGVAAHHRETIFEPFRQGDASDTRRHGGTGLGLAIAKAIVEIHKGKIGVQSDGETSSTFWFELPRA